MELKITNPNDCNIFINNLPFIFYLFSKIFEIEFNKGLQSLFGNKESIIAHKLKNLITNDSLIIMKCFKALYICVNQEN